MMGLPDGQKSFKDRFSRFDTIPAVTDTQPPNHVALASTRYAYVHRAVKRYRKGAITLVIAVRTSKYEDRLKYLDLPTLKCRRISGDLPARGVA